MLHIRKSVIIDLVIFDKRRSRDTKARILCEFLQNESKVVGPECSIRVQISNNVVIVELDSREPGVEGLYLRSKMPLTALGHAHKLNPRMIFNVASDNLVGLVRRTVADHYPDYREYCLGDHRLDRLFDKPRLITGGRYQCVFKIFKCHVSNRIRAQDRSGGHDYLCGSVEHFTQIAFGWRQVRFVVRLTKSASLAFSDRR